MKQFAVKKSIHAYIKLCLVTYLHGVYFLFIAMAYMTEAAAEEWIKTRERQWNVFWGPDTTFPIESRRHSVGVRDLHYDEHYSGEAEMRNMDRTWRRCKR